MRSAFLAQPYVLCIFIWNQTCWSLTRSEAELQTSVCEAAPYRRQQVVWVNLPLQTGRCTGGLSPPRYHSSSRCHIFLIFTGVFLIPYFIMLFFTGVPLFLMELSLGQYGAAGPITVWKCCPLLKGADLLLTCFFFFQRLHTNTITQWHNRETF